MEVAWGHAREAVKVVVKVDVEAVKVVANKRVKLCVATVVMEIVAVHVVPHAECPVAKHVVEHVDSIARGVAMTEAQKMFQIRLFLKMTHYE